MTAEEFRTAYGSKNMYAYAMDEERCHIGRAPRLIDAMHLYGRTAVLATVDDLMQSLINFTSAKSKLTEEQRTRLAWVIVTQYGHLRITELILFVVKAQAGKFGKFYNQIDPLDITTALDTWSQQANAERNRYRLIQYERDKAEEHERREHEYEAHKDEVKTMLLNSQLKINFDKFKL
jgi:hypothetical protein